MGLRTIRRKKMRRNSGRRFPRCHTPQKILNEEGIQLEEKWDDWVDWRDGIRDWSYLDWKKRDIEKSRRKGRRKRL